MPPDPAPAHALLAACDAAAGVLGRRDWCIATLPVPVHRMRYVPFSGWDPGLPFSGWAFPVFENGRAVLLCVVPLSGPPRLVSAASGAAVASALAAAFSIAECLPEEARLRLVETLAGDVFWIEGSRDTFVSLRHAAVVSGAAFAAEAAAAAAEDPDDKDS